MAAATRHALMQSFFLSAATSEKRLRGSRLLSLGLADQQRQEITETKPKPTENEKYKA